MAQHQRGRREDGDWRPRITPTASIPLTGKDIEDDIGAIASAQAASTTGNISGRSSPLSAFPHRSLGIYALIARKKAPHTEVAELSLQHSSGEKAAKFKELSFLAARAATSKKGRGSRGA